jgi:hypothetical protein
MNKDEISIDKHFLVALEFIGEEILSRGKVLNKQDLIHQYPPLINSHALESLKKNGLIKIDEQTGQIFLTEKGLNLYLRLREIKSEEGIKLINLIMSILLVSSTVTYHMVNSNIPSFIMSFVISSLTLLLIYLSVSKSDTEIIKKLRKR